MSTEPYAAQADQLAKGAVSSRWRWLDSSSEAFAYLLNLPALIVIFALIAYPIGYSFWISLHKYNLKQPNRIRFIGLENYKTILTDSTFLNSLKVSVEFSVVSVFFIVVISIAIALLLNETFIGRGVMRSLVLLPWAIPGVVNGLMWGWIFNAKVGALNGSLYSLGFIDHYQSFLGNPQVALLFASFAHVWNMVPFSVIILLAGLSTIPKELYDAARVDRCGVVARFRNVTLPWLLHPLLIVLILQTMNAFRTFDTIYILTGGGPGNATNVIALQTVRTVLDYTDFGAGNAYAYIIMLITLFISLFYVGVLYKRGSFEV